MSQLGKHPRDDSNELSPSLKRIRIETNNQSSPINLSIPEIQPTALNTLAATAISQSVSNGSQSVSNGSQSVSNGSQSVSSNTPTESKTVSTAPESKTVSTAPESKTVSTAPESKTVSTAPESKTISIYQLNNTSENKLFTPPTTYVDSNHITMHHHSDCQIRYLHKVMNVSKSISSLLSPKLELIFKKSNVYILTGSINEWKNLHYLFLITNNYLNGMRYVGPMRIEPFVKYEIRPNIVRSLILDTLLYYSTINTEHGYLPLLKGSATLKEMLYNINNRQYEAMFANGPINRGLTERDAWEYHAKYICRFSEHAYDLGSHQQYAESKNIIITYIKNLIMQLEISGISRYVLNQLHISMPEHLRQLISSYWFGAGI